MGKKKALTPRQLILKSRYYRFFGLIFAAVGLFVFITVFAKGFTTDEFISVQELPMLLLIVLTPFLPACVLSWIAASAEKKALAALGADKK